jgi:hypothetical protein
MIENARRTSRQRVKIMKIKHIESTDLWLVSKGDKILYRGRVNPWRSPGIIARVLKREGKLFRYFG